MDIALCRILELPVIKEIPSSSHGQAKTAGIYALEHPSSNMFYVGSTADLYKREKEHIGDLRRNEHRNGNLQAAYNKISEVVFFAIPTSSREEAYDLEQALLSTAGKHGRLFNISTDARVAGKGVPASLEKKARMSAAHTGVSLSEEHKRNIGLANTGKVFTQERRSAISKANTGKIVSIETRGKIRDTLTGRKATPEARQAISDALKGKAVHPNSVANLGGQAKAVSVNGKIYDSIQAAADDVGVGKSTAHARVNNTNPNFSGWFYIAKEKE